MVHLIIATPQGTIYEDKQIKSLTVPTAAGVITIMDDHIPFVSIITAGELIIDKGDHQVELAVSKGIIEIRRESEIHILADTAERAEEIDLARAEEARQKAIEYLKRKQDIADVEFARVQAKIDKELARINVAKKNIENKSKLATLDQF